MNKKSWWIVGGVLVVAAVAAGMCLLYRDISDRSDADYKNIAYVIEGKRIQLKDGAAETEVMPGSASKIVTRYFGNDLKTDLNDDGREDVVFLLTQQTGGSGVFYYVVAALTTPHGYVGSDGFFIGDRIAPQTTEMSRDPRRARVVVNFADHASGQPMTEQPTEGKSVLLNFDPDTLEWSPASGDAKEEPVQQ